MCLLLGLGGQTNFCGNPKVFLIKTFDGHLQVGCSLPQSRVGIFELVGYQLNGMHSA